MAQGVWKAGLSQAGRRQGTGQVGPCGDRDGKARKGLAFSRSERSGHPPRLCSVHYLGELVAGFLTAFPMLPAPPRHTASPWGTLGATSRGVGVSVEKKEQGLGNQAEPGFTPHPHLLT